VFRYPEYEQFFSDRLCADGEDLEKYNCLFDFRESAILKRREFSRLKCLEAWHALEPLYGRVCQLQFPGICDRNNPADIDHVIPLSSNELNKKIRGAKALSEGKKVAAESFGSNHISNLVLACKRCNAYKKHRFLDRAAMRRILQSKGF
jgi:5-methylcytosine-specific restriction endonuclease McrA